MDSSSRVESKGDNLNDSWVDIHFQQQQQQGSCPSEVPALLRPLSIHNGAMEKLLLEAQKESRETSRTQSNASSRGSPHHSPKGPHSPKSEIASSVISGEPLSSIVEREVGTEWIWDWSSRPEALPPSEFMERLKRPGHLKVAAPVKKVGVFNFDNLPVLLLTHACTFFLGAAAMFVYLKKYCTWTIVSTSSLD